MDTFKLLNSAVSRDIVILNHGQLIHFSFLPTFPPFSIHHSPSAYVSHSVMTDSLWPHGLQPTRLLCPWDSPGQGYWSGLPVPSPEDLLDPGIEPSLLHCRQILYHLNHQEAWFEEAPGEAKSLQCQWLWAPEPFKALLSPACTRSSQFFRVSSVLSCSVVAYFVILNK